MITVNLKLVPDSAPDSEGEWVGYDMDDSFLQIQHKDWAALWATLQSLCGPGYRVVRCYATGPSKGNIYSGVYDQ